MKESRLRIIDSKYFIYREKPVAMFGSGYWTIVPEKDFCFEEHNERYRRYGCNLTRILAFTTWWSRGDRDRVLHPWNRNGGGVANDGGERFDLTSYDIEYWDRLRNYLGDCEEKEIFVILQFFDECSLEKGDGAESGNSRWLYHPFNPDNNVNLEDELPGGDSTSIPQFYDIENKPVMRLQNLYVEKLLEETSCHGNIIYEIANEYTFGGHLDQGRKGQFEWSSHWADVFALYSERNHVALILSQMPFMWNREEEIKMYFEHDGFHAVDIYPLPECSRHDIKALRKWYFRWMHRGKPVFSGRVAPKPMDLSKPWNTLSQGRKHLWTIFVSGGHGTFKAEDHEGRYDVDREKYIVEMIWNLRKFIETTKFWKMHPTDTLIGSKPLGTLSAFGLTESGKEYVLYLTGRSEGGELRIDIKSGRYEIKFYDPKSGEYIGESEQVFEFKRSTLLCPPYDEDLVIHIQRTLA